MKSIKEQKAAVKASELDEEMKESILESIKAAYACGTNDTTKCVLVLLKDQYEEFHEFTKNRHSRIAELEKEILDLKVELMGKLGYSASEAGEKLRNEFINK